MKNRIPMGLIEESAIPNMELEALICRKNKVIVITYEWKLVTSNFNGTTSIMKCYYLNGKFLKADVIGTEMKK